MLARLLIIALYVWTNTALPHPPDAQLLQNVSAIDHILAVPLDTSTATANGECFSDRRLHPASHIDCMNAARYLLRGIENPHRPVAFARKGKAGVKLPRTVRDRTCVISLDVADDDGRDRFQPWAAYTAAMSLANKCLGRDHLLGGKRTVGPKNVVDLILFGREWPAGNSNDEAGGGLVLELSNSTTFNGGETDGNATKMRNTSSLDLATQPLVNAASLDVRHMCFEPPKAHEIRGATDRGDCHQAADDMIKSKPRNIPLTVSRDPSATFTVPARFSHGTCSIYVDVLNTNDQDRLDLWTLWSAAVDVANHCTMSASQAVDIWGGIRTAGLSGLVSVVILGIVPADMASAATTSGTRHVVARSQAKGKVPMTGGGSFLSSDVPILEAVVGDGKPGLNTSVVISNGPSIRVVPNLGGPLTCYDPPLPRERLFQLVSSDCDKAQEQIIGERNKWDRYIFSRKPVTGFNWYQLPAKLTYGTCVILIDMKNDEDEDVVRLNYVASSAWVLAHKCSGEEIPEDKYGGFMTVSVGATDLIIIHVYGRPLPPPAGQGPILALSQNASLLDRE